MKSLKSLFDWAMTRTEPGDDAQNVTRFILHDLFVD